MMIQRGQGWYGGGQRRCLSAGEGFLKERLARHDGWGWEGTCVLGRGNSVQMNGWQARESTGPLANGVRFRVSLESL